MTVVNPAAKKQSPWFSNGVYDFLKQLAQYWFPAVAVFYAAVASIWGLPGAVQVVGTIAAIDVLLGALLGLSTSVYNNSDAPYDGALVVDSSGTADTHSLAFNAPLATLATQKTITLKVTPSTDSTVATTPVTDEGSGDSGATPSQ